MSSQAKHSPTRRDRTGELGRSLDELIDRGERLRDQASTIAAGPDLDVFREEHRMWVLSCLPVLASGFEPETVTEFVHVVSRVSFEPELSLAVRSTIAANADAVEFLRGLRSTL
jgi:hypothetical protein